MHTAASARRAPEIGPKFPAPLINFVSLGGTFSDVGRWVSRGWPASSLLPPTPCGSASNSLAGSYKDMKRKKLPPPLCDIPSGCCFFTGPWTVTRSSLRMLRRVAAFCRPLRPVLLLVSFPRSRSPVVGVLGLC